MDRLCAQALGTSTNGFAVEKQLEETKELEHSQKT